MAETAGRIEFGKDNKTKRKIIITPEAESAEPVEYTLPKGRHLAVREGDFVEIGDLLVDGNPVPHDILRIKGIEALADYLINEIQDVYRLQGVKINDKHIEVIIRQMLQKVDVIDQGESTFLVGEQVDKITMRQENTKLLAEGKRPAVGEPVLQGITKASLQTHSFISAASFQETTRVLTESATAGRVDYLMGLKENVIVGRLIPAGTGSVYNRYRSIARQRDYVTAQPQAITDQYVSLGQPSHDLLGDEAA
jgi:DNA-directed RNA polymerase subunit beta'